MIKNCFVYNATLPDHHAMADALAKCPYQPIGEAEYKRTSFVPNVVTQELVTPIDGGYSFVFRCDEKILPSAAIKSALLERVREIETEQDRKVTRAEKKQLQDEVEFDLLRKALVKTTEVHGFYNAESGLLILSTGSGTMADRVMEEMGKAFDGEGVDARLVVVDDLQYRLTKRLIEHVSSSETVLFGDYLLGNYVQMKNADGDKATFESPNHDPSEGIQEAHANGCLVERIELTREGFSFRITKEFYLKSIRYPEVDVDFDAGEDGAGYWRHEAATAVLLITQAVENLVEAFDIAANLQGAA